MGSFLSDTFFKSFSSKYVYVVGSLSCISPVYTVQCTMYMFSLSHACDQLLWINGCTHSFLLRGGPDTSSKFIKGSQQWESRGARNVSICPNLARTAAIEVRFSINFAVVFDFIYFRFRPSKAKWIGNVLPNRWNAVNYLQRFFFWINFICCVICVWSNPTIQTI